MIKINNPLLSRQYLYIAYRYFFKVLLGTIILSSLTACGGGNDNNTNIAPINNNNNSNWQAGIFESENNFKNLCQSPRNGFNPFSGQAYPDRPGTVLDENNWLRSWSNNTYLWYNEITDRNPALFANTIDYFNLLKTNALTASGNPKDKFHFTFPTDEWQQLNQAGTSAGYGAIFRIISSTPPREVRVVFIEPGTQAESHLSRGTEILTVDGVDLINDNTTAGINIINAGLFPNNNESHQFVVRDVGSTATRTITMTSSIISANPVQKVNTFTTGSGTNVGYFLFNTHNQPAEQGLINAVNQLASSAIDELILDLRYNSGGLLAIASQLAYMVAGSTATTNKIFEQSVFNDKHSTVNPVTGITISPMPFITQSLGFSASAGQSLPSLNLSRVFILTTDETCSASEAIINGLRGINIDVVLIGSTTCGKPYGFYPSDNCGTTYFTVQFKGENDSGFGDYADGFSPANSLNAAGVIVPGCAIDDDFSKALGDTQEDLLAGALHYIENGGCPVKTLALQNNGKKSVQTGLSLFDSKIYQSHILLRKNRFISKAAADENVSN